MTSKTRRTPGLAGALLLTLALPAGAQNLLQNGGFEDHPAANWGDNLSWNVDFTPWQSVSVTVQQGGGQMNLVKVDGPGGYHYAPGPQSDASAPGAGIAQHFLDTSGLTYVWQNFTAPCDGQVRLSAAFSQRENGGAHNGSQNVLGLVPLGASEPEYSGFASNPPGPEVADLVTQFLALTDTATLSFPAGPSDGAWHLANTTGPVGAGQRYAFIARLGEHANMDNAAVEYITRDVASCLPVDGGDLTPLTPTPAGGLPGTPTGPVGPSGDPAEPTDPGGSGTPGDPGGPDKPDLPEARQIFLKKACEPPVADMQNGQPGMAWRCEVTVAALPAPFAGSFQFTEDASQIIGASGLITGYSASPGWTCPGLPATQTSCTIQGADFDASGVETLGFDLFAPAAGPVAWKNCVSGLYAGGDSKREVKGNCDGTEWKPDGDDPGKPDKPTEFDVEKTCAPSGERQEFSPAAWVQPWRCEITVTTNGAPWSGPITLADDFHFGSLPGASQIQSITSADPWACTPAPYAPGTPPVCTIQGSQFPTNPPASTLVVDLVMAGALADQNGAENCATLTDARGTPLGRDCTTLHDPLPDLPKPEQAGISKTCTELSEQRHNGTLWGLGWECDVRVTAAPAPFAGSFGFLEDASGVIGAAGAEIVSVNASPGWTCTPAPGGGQAQTACTIDGADFDPSGQEVLRFELFAGMSNLPEQPVTWENCVSGASDPAANPREVSDCVTASWSPPPPPEPSLDISKTCDEPVPAGSTGWDVACTVTITGADLPPGLSITVYDVLSGSNGANPQSGTLSGPAGLSGGVQCSGGLGAGLVLQNCTVSTDDLMAAGGTLSFPYTGHIALDTGSAPEAMNCASFQLRDSQGNGVAIGNVGVAQCATLALPDLPTGTGGTGGTTGTTGGTAPDCGVDVLFVVDRSGSMNWYNRIAQVRAGVQMAQNAFAGNGSAGGLILFNATPALAVPLPDPLPSASIANTLASLPASGGTRWDRAFALASQVVSAAARKPLVLFITDGVSNEPLANSIPLVANIRAQGSRIIGIPIGTGSTPGALTALLGGNVVNTATGATPDPFTDDVVVIPNGANMPAIFAQMAQAYCPQRAARPGIGEVIDLHLPAEPYAGDDEPAQPSPNPAPEPQPELELEKQALGPCRVDEGKRQYVCDFSLTLKNGGDGAFSGPLALVDRLPRPRPKSVRVEAEGWQCSRMNPREVTCYQPDLTLQPGESTSLGLRVRLPGLEAGGQYRNCAGIGLPEGKAGRVALAQRIMNGLGINAGPVDGKPGRKTYGALSQLRARLGLPDSRAFDDALFAALGLPLEGARDCAGVSLPEMPRPALQCDRATTRPTEQGCACSDPRAMVRRSETSCACRNGLPAINGRCPSVSITPGGDGPAGGGECRLRINGICLQ